MEHLQKIRIMSDEYPDNPTRTNKATKPVYVNENP